MRILVFLKQTASLWSNKELNYMQTADFQVVKLDPGSKRGFSQCVPTRHCAENGGNPCELLSVAGSWYVG